jgi:hypothetical protein
VRTGVLLVTALSLLGCEQGEAPSRDVPVDVGVDATDASSRGETGADAGGRPADCPATSPILDEPCSFTSDCAYFDPTTADAGFGCWFSFACRDGRVARGPIQLFALGCPTERPVNGRSCTCGWHLFGESSFGDCEYPCVGGKMVATCGGGDAWSSGPGSATWSLSSCISTDAGDDGG